MSTTPGKKKGLWSEDEHQRYVEGLKLHGANFAVLEAFIQTRSQSQIRYYHGKQLSQKLKGAAVVAKLAAATQASPNKRKMTDDQVVAEAMKKHKVAQVSNSKPPVGQPKASTKKSAISSPNPTPNLLPLAPRPSSDPVPLDSKDDLKPPVMSQPVVTAKPPIMKLPVKSVPEKPASISVEKPGSADTANVSTSAAVHPSKTKSGVGSGVLKMLNRESVQCVVGGLLGFGAVWVTKKFV